MITGTGSTDPVYLSVSGCRMKIKSFYVIPDSFCFERNEWVQQAMAINRFSFSPSSLGRVLRSEIRRKEKKTNLCNKLWKKKWVVSLLLDPKIRWAVGKWVVKKGTFSSCVHRHLTRDTTEGKRCQGRFATIKSAHIVSYRPELT